MFRFRSHTFRLSLLGLGSCVLLAGFANHATGHSDSRVFSEKARVGIDNAELRNFASLRGKRVGLVTNEAAVDAAGKRTLDILAHAPGIRLVALFSPEHGLNVNRDSAVADSMDASTALPIYSLYGDTRRPTDEMLKNVDVLAFDIQDAGVRFYTYVTTMAYCMEVAAKHHIPFVIFDRPDPLGGENIEGPMLDPGRTSFTGYFPMPVRYGMTMGELAKMFNAENHIGAKLEIWPLQNWHRGETYDQTGLTWIPPSPNLRTVKALFIYPGLDILQAGGVSVGRGTDTPFEVLGAPWIRGSQLAVDLNKRQIPGVAFKAAKFTPTEAPYKGQSCEGVRIIITNRETFRSVRMGLEIAESLNRLYPQNLQIDKIMFLLGSQSTLDRLKRGDPPADIIAGWSSDLEKFRRMRAKYLLYH